MVPHRSSSPPPRRPAPASVPPEAGLPPGARGTASRRTEGQAPFRIFEAEEAGHGRAAEDRIKAAELPEGDVIRILLEQHARIRDLFSDV